MYNIEILDFFFFLKIFLMWTFVLFFLKVFIEFVTLLFLFYVLVFWSQGMWDLSSLTRDQTCTPCIGRRSLNHWTTREVPRFLFIVCYVMMIFFLSEEILQLQGMLLLSSVWRVRCLSDSRGLRDVESSGWLERADLCCSEPTCECEVLYV